MYNKSSMWWYALWYTVCVLWYNVIMSIVKNVIHINSIYVLMLVCFHCPNNISTNAWHATLGTFQFENSCMLYIAWVQYDFVSPRIKFRSDWLDRFARSTPYTQPVVYNKRKCFLFSTDLIHRCHSRPKG